MRKSKELTDPNSCLNKATSEEMLFVLLGRDPAASVAIRAWCHERMRQGLNKIDDPKIQEALRCAETMHLESQGLGQDFQRKAELAFEDAGSE